MEAQEETSNSDILAKGPLSYGCTEVVQGATYEFKKFLPKVMLI